MDIINYYNISNNSSELETKKQISLGYRPNNSFFPFILYYYILRKVAKALCNMITLNICLRVQPKVQSNQNVKLSRSVPQVAQQFQQLEGSC